MIESFVAQLGKACVNTLVYVDLCLPLFTATKPYFCINFRFWLRFPRVIWIFWDLPAESYCAESISPGYLTAQSQSPRSILLRRVNLPPVSYCGESVCSTLRFEKTQWNLKEYIRQHMNIIDNIYYTYKWIHKIVILYLMSTIKNYRQSWWIIC